MNDIRHRASPFALIPLSVRSLPKFIFIIKAQLDKAKMRYISEIIFLLVTTTAALIGEKINISVLKPCKHSEVSLKTGQGNFFFARPTNPQSELKQKLKKLPVLCIFYI